VFFVDNVLFRRTYMFGFGSKESTAKVPTKFSMPIKRKRADGGDLEFNVMVSGFFFGSKGKPGFTISSASVDGLPNMTLNATEIAEIEKYAVNIQYKKLFGTA
jgi:hypothetical protein